MEGTEPGSDGEEELLAAGNEQHSDDMDPRNLTALFGEGQAPKKDTAPGAQASTQVAGAGLDDEFEMKKLQVFVRIRPSVTKGAPRWDTENCIHATSKFSIAIAPPEASQAYKNGDRGQTYSFTRVFDEETPQLEYFANTAEPLVRDLLRNPRHNSVMMAYGITAAGKTYTIEGTHQQPGVMPRALEALFQGLQSHVETLSVRVSYYEVYNEQIFDLLEDAPLGPGQHRPALRLKEDNQGRVLVGGLTEVEVTSAEEALEVQRRGSKQRQRAQTGLNYNSSRSHSIFTVMLYQPRTAAAGGDDAADQQEEDEGEQEQRLGRLSFVDLAGSERAQRTGNVGVRLKESVAINSSLMTLGRCLEALRWNQQHKNGAKVVPYRESKVTHLFRDALHGWGQVILSVNVSPCAKDYDETSHVLKYAALATQIGTIQQAEAPRRVLKAVSPAIKKVKRKAALPAEARGGGVRVKRAKKVQPQLPAVDVQPASPPAADEAAGGDGSGLENAELDFNGTPLTPLDDGEAEAAIADLQAQVQELMAQLQRAEERCILVEAEVREEVAQEMEQLLREMEASYRERLAAEVAQLERRLAAAPQQGAGASRRGRQRGGAAAFDLLDDATSAPAAAAEAAAAQLQAALAAAEGRAGQLQEQVAALEEQISAMHQAAEQREDQLQHEAKQAVNQIALLQAELAAAQQIAADAQQHLKEQCISSSLVETELEAARLRNASLQVEANSQRQRADVLATEVLSLQQQLDASEQEAAERLESTLEAEVTQLETNRAMEVEMLEEQLLRAKKDNAALCQRLEAAMATLVTMASPSMPLMQRMAQACPAGNGRGAGGTPHEVALARARQAAAEEQQLAPAGAPAAASAHGKRSKLVGQLRTRFGGGLADSQPASVNASEQQEQQEPQQHERHMEGQQEHAAATHLEMPTAAASEHQRTNNWDQTQASLAKVHGMEHPQPPGQVQAGQPAANAGDRGSGSAVAMAPPAQSKRGRRATRASAASSSVTTEVQHVPQMPASRAAASGAAAVTVGAENSKRTRRRGRKATEAAAAVLAASEVANLEVAVPACDPAVASEEWVLQQARPTQAPPEEQQKESGKAQHKGGRSHTSVSQELATVSAARQEQVERQEQECQEPAAEGEAACAQPAEGCAPQQPAAVRRRGWRTMASTGLASIAEEAACEGSHGMPGEPTSQPVALQQESRGASGTLKSRRGSAITRKGRHHDKENESTANGDGPAASASKLPAIAELPEEVAEAGKLTSVPGPDTEATAVATTQPAAAQTAATKRRRKLLPAKFESREMRSALGEEGEDGMSLGLVKDKQAAAAAVQRRPRRQTQFFRL
ncbi:hypothetical protein N2152v2_011211 [Parachlorella kessleri]